jgi:CRISPR/Cas system-associated exonuclease Cas4 (RecB family)
MHRARQTAHPLMQAYGIDAVPFDHEKMNEWRENFKGVQYHHDSTNLLVTGAIDDLWVDPTGEVMVVDYKATSKTEEVNLDADWQISYKRQMEVYQWLLTQNGFRVSKIGYFVYCNGNADKEAFDAKLEFNIKIIPYIGNNSWVERTLDDIQKCLQSDMIPPAGKECDYCIYRTAAAKVESDAPREKKSHLADTA